MQSSKALLKHQKSYDVGSIIHGMNDSMMFTRKLTRTVVLTVYLVVIVFLTVIFESHVTSGLCILAEFIKIYVI